MAGLHVPSSGAETRLSLQPDKGPPASGFVLWHNADLPNGAWASQVGHPLTRPQENPGRVETHREDRVAGGLELRPPHRNRPFLTRRRALETFGRIERLKVTRLRSRASTGLSLAAGRKPLGQPDVLQLIGHTDDVECRAAVDALAHCTPLSMARSTFIFDQLPSPTPTPLSWLAMASRLMPPSGIERLTPTLGVIRDAEVGDVLAHQLVPPFGCAFSTGGSTCHRAPQPLTWCWMQSASAW